MDFITDNINALSKNADKAFYGSRNGNTILWEDTVPSIVSLKSGTYHTEQVEKALDFYFQHHPEELL